MIALLFIFFNVSVISDVVIADTGNFEFVGEPKYELLTNDPPRYRYIINVSLKNNDNVESPLMIIRLLEDDVPTLVCEKCEEGIIFEANEQKYLIFDYNTSSPDKDMKITYAPLDPNLENNENKGSISFTLSNKKDSSKGIPGFELVLVILSFIILICISKKNKR